MIPLTGVFLEMEVIYAFISTNSCSNDRAGKIRPCHSYRVGSLVIFFHSRMS